MGHMFPLFFANESSTSGYFFLILLSNYNPILYMSSSWFSNHWSSNFSWFQLKYLHTEITWSSFSRHNISLAFLTFKGIYSDISSWEYTYIVFDGLTDDCFLFNLGWPESIYSSFMIESPSSSLPQPSSLLPQPSSSSPQPLPSPSSSESLFPFTKLDLVSIFY